MRRGISGLLLGLLNLLPLAGCGGGSEPTRQETAQLSEMETFRWGEQGIRLAPPGPEWERHRWQQGGLEGVSFQLPRVPPARILVAEYRSLHRRHSLTNVSSGRRVDFAAAPPNATLDQVLDRVQFRPDNMPDPSTVETGGLAPREVGGRPAYTLDYTWHDGRHLFFGREVYVMAYGALFEITLLGVETDAPLFDRVVASVQFPPPPPGKGAD